MKRLFVAVPVSEGIRDKIKPIAQALSETDADLKLVSLSNLHFTLKFLGDVEEKNIPEIENKLAGIAEKTKRFEVSVKSVGVFPSLDRISVVWIGAENSELFSLMKTIGKELDFIKKNDHEEDVPHLTLARVKTNRNQKELQEFVKKFENTGFGKMMVDKLILFESELRREGAVYRVIKGWELGQT
ncbi:RNA 2',3'-cyclic phosphodiesterase [Candidatus Woesearchaeota archaeon]|nr:RNA 2',3'-cyclic phosphodiesterase [Candidatus Woesearchaeota archaeon]